MEDTIAAISTPIGEGGLAVIRVSGGQALAIADRVFANGSGQPSSWPTHTIHPGTIRRDGEVIDRVLLSVMHAPRTYTGETTVEINCHGGPLMARTILGLCLEGGARLAEPGEFTKRAFLNGKLDLAQAEAVMDLITAHTTRAQAAAARALEGQLSTRVNALRDDLVGVLAHLEAHLDFPDEDIAPETEHQLVERIERIINELDELLQTARDGRILRHGIAVTIAGRPNAGKSSLMNTLLGHERAIVTEVPGTTRDTIEDYLNLNGIPIKLIDTAGIREASDQVEQIGVARSHKSLETSDIVLYLVDGSTTFDEADSDLANKFAEKSLLIVINKSDLPVHCVIPTTLTHRPQVSISAKTGDGVANLKKLLTDLIHVAPIGAHQAEVLINDRHKTALVTARKNLTTAAESMKQDVGFEVTAQQLRLGLDAVGEVVGKTSTNDILERVFSSFCIGK